MRTKKKEGNARFFQLHMPDSECKKIQGFSGCSSAETDLEIYWTLRGTYKQPL